MNTLEKLTQLKSQIIDNNVCPELKEQATQLVFGDGNPNADMVFIGEAPGKKEDETGKPFVGAAGKFLNEMLETIGLKREDIYITNIVKYRPPNNRDPLPEEKKAFLPYLQTQLELIQPKVVVTLGRHSMNCFLPGVPSCASCTAGGPPEQCSDYVASEHRKDNVATATLSAEHKDTKDIVRSGGSSSVYAGRACATPLQISKIHGEPKRIRISMKGSNNNPKINGSSGVGGDGSSTMQGKAEQRSKRDEKSSARAEEALTPQRAEKAGRDHSSAVDHDSLAIVILPLYHPAAALYNGAMRQTLLDDFAQIPTILKKIN